MKANPSFLGGAFLLGAGAILLAGGLWVGFQSRFQATVRIKITEGTPLVEPRWQGKEVPASIKAGLADIYNSLGAVVESLNLATEWGERKTADATARLQRNTDIRPIFNTSLIEIRVASRNPEEAARIANRIAEVNRKPPGVQLIDSATAPAGRGFPNFARELRVMALGGLLLAAGLFVWFDARRSGAGRTV